MTTDSDFNPAIDRAAQARGSTRAIDKSRASSGYANKSKQPCKH
jgi:hypothetical protein